MTILINFQDKIVSTICNKQIVTETFILDEEPVLTRVTKARHYKILEKPKKRSLQQ